MDGRLPTAERPCEGSNHLSEHGIKGTQSQSHSHSHSTLEVPRFSIDGLTNTDPSLLPLSTINADSLPIEGRNTPSQQTCTSGDPLSTSTTTEGDTGETNIDPRLGESDGVMHDGGSRKTTSSAKGAYNGIDPILHADRQSAENTPFEGAISDEASVRRSRSHSKRPSVPSMPEDNDAELRRLAHEHAEVGLDELAKRVRNDENTPSAEKTRQIYGLGWLMRNCERVPDTTVAVPRNRVYARYVSLCASERIKPLNPASFGKLVRLLYPEIKTRRLGVRGHSKYHYCGIRLVGEQSPLQLRRPSSASGSEPATHTDGDDHLMNKPARSNISEYPDSGHMVPPKAAKSRSPLSEFMLTELRFLSNEDDGYSNTDEISLRLPSIEEHCPPGTNLDDAATLAACYLSHCTSLIECIRYMRLKQFQQLLATFNGALTMPVQKLLGNLALASWIRESDWAMYKEMIRLLSPLALQVVPSFVLIALKQLSTTLASHISTSFTGLPLHVTHSRMGPALIFSSLVDRLLRVNDAAHAAARFLGNQPDREQMINDWRTYVNTQTIVDREIPCYSPTVREILDEAVALLNDNASPPPGDGYTESVLDRWTQFLTQVPLRFPDIAPRHFNLCLGAVSSAALRDLTTNGAMSFGSWWVVRCWIDEWMAWLAERGGFLAHATERRLCSEYNQSQHSPTPFSNAEELGHDDSGISLRGDEAIALLDEVGDDHVNHLIPVKFGK